MKSHRFWEDRTRQWLRKGQFSTPAPPAMLVEQSPCVLPSLTILEQTLRSFVPSALSDERLFNELQIDSNATAEKVDFFWR